MSKKIKARVWIHILRERKDISKTFFRKYIQIRFPISVSDMLHLMRNNNLKKGGIQFSIGTFNKLSADVKLLLLASRIKVEVKTMPRSAYTEGWRALREQRKKLEAGWNKERAAMGYKIQ